MLPEDIAKEFYSEIFRLFGWEYSSGAVKDKSITLRAAAKKFIYDDLSAEVLKSIYNRAKSSKMAVPPSLHLVISDREVQERTLIAIAKARSAKDINDLESLLNKNSASPEEKAEFDKILSLMLPNQ